jgi:E3 ubiquitin-protein ligase NEDD4
VTNDNKKEYVQLIVEWRIQGRVKDQFSAFLSGFNELIPQELINVFDERELEVRGLLTLCETPSLTSASNRSS